jgi:protein MpaA
MKRGIAFYFLTSFFLTSQLIQASEKPVPTAIEKWCSEVEASVAQLKWKIKPCDRITWQTGGTSIDGRPLVFAEFGDANSTNTTLVFSTVHGDEITPLYLGIQLANWLKERQGDLQKTRVVIAPLVNPDGFFKRPRSRLNSRGVDVNRNFATRDWKTKKHLVGTRRFPGKEPMSEPETKFQADLIRKIHPQKILSIHSPLKEIDYDGPTALSLSRFPLDYARECERLKKKLNAVSTGYYPGSLGNYAGHELGIPTVTLELPSTDANKAERYWKQFSHGIHTMIQFTVPNYVATNFDQKHGG